MHPVLPRLRRHLYRNRPPRGAPNWTECRSSGVDTGDLRPGLRTMRAGMCAARPWPLPTVRRDMPRVRQRLPQGANEPPIRSGQHAVHGIVACCSGPPFPDCSAAGDCGAPRYHARHSSGKPDGVSLANRVYPSFLWRHDTGVHHKRRRPGQHGAGKGGNELLDLRIGEKPLGHQTEG